MWWRLRVEWLHWNMTKWFQGDSNSNNEVVLKGMILDGALSLLSLQKKKEMRKVVGEEKKDTQK